MIWETAAGDGKLLSFTEVYRPFAPGFEDELPYVVAVAELALPGQVRIVANLDPDATPKKLVLGATVRISFVDRSSVCAVPAIQTL